MNRDVQSTSRGVEPETVAREESPGYSAKQSIRELDIWQWQLSQDRKEHSTHFFLCTCVDCLAYMYKMYIHVTLRLWKYMYEV